MISNNKIQTIVDFSLNYLRSKTLLLQTSFILEFYYLNKDLKYDDCNPFLCRDVSIDTIINIFRVIVNIEIHYYKNYYGKWATSSYISLSDRELCFINLISYHVKNNTLMTINLFEECDGFYDIFYMIEKNPVLFKRIIISLKKFNDCCKWLLKQEYVIIDDECKKSINHLNNYVDTLEFKSLYFIPNNLLSLEMNSYFNYL